MVNPAQQDDAATLWALAPSGFRPVLDWLTRNGISATPAFAIVEWSGDADSRSLRAIVRGEIRVEVESAGATRMLDGSGVATWTEQVLADVSRVDIGLTTPGHDSPGEPSLPLESGAAFVSRIMWGESLAVNDDDVEATVVQKRVRSVPPKETPARPIEAAATEVSVAAVPEIPVDDANAAVSESTLAQPPEPAALEPAALESTVLEPAAPEPAPLVPAAPEPAAQPDLAGDHDGMTIVSSDIKRMRAQRTTPVALAVVEDQLPLYLELSTGGREMLTGQPVLIGRAPTAHKVSGSSVPRLVIIPGDRDISRNHAQITVEGGTVVVTDLHSRNGTQVVMPGRPAQQLRQGEPTSVIVGTIVDLGGGVTLTVREGD